MRYWEGSVRVSHLESGAVEFFRASGFQRVSPPSYTRGIPSCRKAEVGWRAVRFHRSNREKI